MADEKPTPDEIVAEALSSAAEGQIFKLLQERAVLEKATERIAEIDAILAAYAPEKARLDPRRPPKLNTVAIAEDVKP